MNKIDKEILNQIQEYQKRVSDLYKKKDKLQKEMDIVDMKLSFMAQEYDGLCRDLLKNIS